MPYSIDPISANCYPGTAILVNKLDIRDESVLEEAEDILTASKSTQWLSAPKMSTFDFAHYKAIHFFLFSDLYDWAGNPDICVFERSEFPLRTEKRTFCRSTCGFLLCNEYAPPFPRGQWPYTTNFFASAGTERGLYAEFCENRRRPADDRHDSGSTRRDRSAERIV